MRPLPLARLRPAEQNKGQKIQDSFGAFFVRNLQNSLLTSLRRLATLRKTPGKKGKPGKKARKSLT